MNRLLLTRGPCKCFQHFEQKSEYEDEILWAVIVHICICIVLVLKGRNHHSLRLRTWRFGSVTDRIEIRYYSQEKKKKREKTEGANGKQKKSWCIPRPFLLKRHWISVSNPLPEDEIQSQKSGLMRNKLVASHALRGGHSQTHICRIN